MNKHEKFEVICGLILFGWGCLVVCGLIALYIKCIGG
jgi:hypothetical protein